MHELPLSNAAFAGTVGDSRYPRPSFGTDTTGAGIAGLGANAHNEKNRAGLGTPYNAFAIPGANIPTNGEIQYDQSNAGGGGLQRSGSQASHDLLEAAGLTGVGASSTPLLTRGPSQTTNLSNSASARSKESYADHYKQDFQPEVHKYTVPPNLPTPGGLTPVSAGSMQNPYSPISTTPQHQEHTEVNTDDAYADESYFAPPQPIHSDLDPEDSRRSFRDEDDYGLRSRILKV